MRFLQSFLCLFLSVLVAQTIANDPEALKVKHNYQVILILPILALPDLWRVSERCCPPA